MTQPAEPLPQLFQQVNVLWQQQQQQGTLGDAGKDIKEVMSAIQHILQGFEAVLQGRKSPEAIARFRAEMKQASASLIDTEPIVQVLSSAALPDSRITESMVQQLNTWTRQNLNQMLGILQPSTPSQLGIRPREVIEILETEEVVPPSAKRRRLLKKQSAVAVRPIKMPEPEMTELPDEELVEEGITLNLAPLIWQDMSSKTGVWRYALFTDSQNVMYDRHGPFESQDAAQKHMEEVLARVDAAEQKGYITLFNIAYTAWTTKNENQACRDVQGTERLTIQDDSDEAEYHYLILFTTLGAKQLSKLTEYQTLVNGDESQPEYQAAWEKMMAEITKRKNKWTKSMLKTAKAIMPNVSLMQTRITKCQAVDGNAPILAMISMVLRLPLGTSEDDFKKLDEIMFETL